MLKTYLHRSALCMVISPMVEPSILSPWFAVGLCVSKSSRACCCLCCLHDQSDLSLHLIDINVQTHRHLKANAEFSKLSAEQGLGDVDRCVLFGVQSASMHISILSVLALI